jgi:site-specific DNA recombinase
MANSMFLIYCRRSTDDTLNQKNSLEYQEKAGRQFAKDRKFPVSSDSVEGLIKNGVVHERHSGWKTSPISISGAGLVEYQIERPKFMEVIGLLLQRKYDGLIVLNWDRISRNEQDDMLIKDLIDKKNVEIRFVEADYNHKTSAGKLHRNVDGMVAQYWSDKTSEAISKWHRKLRSEGKLGNQTPIGYIDKGADNKMLDPVRAPIVLRAFEQYATGGWSIPQLMKWANGQGLLSKSRRRKRTNEEMVKGVEKDDLPKLEAPVGRGTIESMLGNAFYLGKVKDLETGIWRHGKHPPLLVDDDGNPNETLFYKVQEVLKTKGHKFHSVDMDFYPFRKLASCTCGRMYSPYRMKGIVYYQLKCKGDCTNKKHNLSEEDIVDIVIEKMSDVHFTDEEVAEIDSGLDSGLDKVGKEQDKEVEDLHREHKEVLEDYRYLEKNGTRLLRQGVHTPESLSQEKTSLDTRRKEVEEKMKEYGERVEEMVEYVLTFSELVEDACGLFKVAPPEEQQRLTVLIFSELVIKDGKLVKWTFAPGFRDLWEFDVSNGGRSQT